MRKDDFGISIKTFQDFL